MVATRRHPIFPGIRLAAGLPLARNPPPGDLDRLGRIGEVQDHHDVAHSTAFEPFAPESPKPPQQPPDGRGGAPAPPHVAAYPPDRALPAVALRVPAIGRGWLHEIKHDGFRVIARKDGPRVRLYGRPGNDLTDRFPLIVEALVRLRSRSL
jgi:ATP dependent DNA ligase domain